MCFCSIEEERGDIFRESRRFGWNLEVLVKKGSLAIVEEKAQYNLTINELYSTIRKLKAKRVVIDSVPARVVAGDMSDTSIASGLKHSSILVLMAVVVAGILPIVS